MHIEQIIRTIERTAPLAAAADWDHSGLQVASHRVEASSLAVCLDPIPASVSAAIEGKADFILAHHPLSLRPSLPCRLDEYNEVLRLLFKADIPLYSAHTSLDANSAGPAGWLARELRLKNLSVLEPSAYTAQESPAPPFGFGFCGDLPSPITLRELGEALRKRIDLETSVLVGKEPDAITRIAYCTGSGASLAGEALAAGAQIYITGDVKYHAALSARTCVLDVGHHSLEEEMMRLFSLQLQKELSGLNVFFVPSISPFRPFFSCR
ncbi:MAG: Nif3-like dinuclear metal center hexameric protein [Desulfovibrio sp.]|nr:Nif3-like dinuclear metal center hexameric protein [Desulfovibrio sp.]